jgi:molybdenum cofactor cytidylyltransferase
MNIAGILLAAGAGTRFGGGKLLAEIAPGVPMCVAALNNLRSGVDEVFAVVRVGDERVAQVLSEAGARIVVCADAHEGMGASLSCGVRAAAHAQAWIVALGDMPLIAPATIGAVADALRSSHAPSGTNARRATNAPPPGTNARRDAPRVGDAPHSGADAGDALIVAPSYRGERAHPVGFGAALRDGLLSCTGDTGARALIQAHRSALRLIEVDDAGVLVDFDTREQLAQRR